MPVRFNDGQPVPDELISDTLVDLRRRFHAASSETQLIRGQWQHAGQTYHDELLRRFVDVPDTPENRQFFQEFKEQLKIRFRQIDIRMTAHPIDVV